MYMYKVQARPLVTRQNDDVIVTSFVICCESVIGGEVSNTHEQLEVS